ncbi:MAG: class I SAM-dependent methyltransferase [bacterium]
MEKIKDYSVYNEGMKKSLLDKIFFIDKIDARVIIDYGCADGTLIKFLSDLFPEYQYVGYDIDDEMLKQAKAKFNKNNDRIIFTSDWNVVKEYSRSGVSAILLSSVIHEVYAYGTRKDVETVWNRIFDDIFDYIVIRDMIPSFSIDKKSDINDVRRIFKFAKSGMLRDFEQIWGSIEQNKNLVHFLLKYRYSENWEREVRENYFPLTREDFIRMIPENYEIEFHEHFILPFLKKTVKNDFGILLKDNTHFKMILRKEV